MKKFVAALAVIPLVVGLSSCGNSTSASDTNGGCKAPSNSDSNTVKIGVVGSEAVNDALKEEASKEGINVEYVSFSDYSQPNPALCNGDFDMNRFQHIAYLANYNVDSDKHLEIVGSTVIYPMALFSKKHKSLNEIPQGGEVAIPNDTVNLSRALLLLKANNLVTFKTDSVDKPTADDIDTEKSKVKVTTVDASQTAVSLDSLDGAVVNNDYIKNAGLQPKDALAQDDPKNPSAVKYVNLFVAQKDKADDEKYKKVVEIFHREPVQKVLQEETKGSSVSVSLSIDELRQALTKEEDKLKNAK